MFDRLRSLFRPRADKGVELDVMWGGYYASRQDDGQFGVFRLLDFNQSAYHAALFQEKFPAPPTLAQVTALSPFVGHAPIDVRGLLAPPVQLLGAVPLTPEDLEGYMLFLEHHDVPPEERSRLQANILGFSREAPLRLRLTLVSDQLQIAQRK